MQKTQVKPKARKGQNLGLFNNAVSLGLIMFLVAAVVIGLQAFKDSQTSGSASDTILNYTLTFFLNATEQLGTAGVILGVGFIISIVVIAVAFGVRRRGSL